MIPIDDNKPQITNQRLSEEQDQQIQNHEHLNKQKKIKKMVTPLRVLIGLILISTLLMISYGAYSLIQKQRSSQTQKSKDKIIDDANNSQQKKNADENQNQNQNSGTDSKKGNSNNEKNDNVDSTKNSDSSTNSNTHGKDGSGGGDEDENQNGQKNKQIIDNNKKADTKEKAESTNDQSQDEDDSGENNNQEIRWNNDKTNDDNAGKTRT